MAVRIQMRRGTTSQWNTADPILNEGEIGYNTTLAAFKVGDGSTVWSELDYYQTAASITPAEVGAIALTEKGAANGVAELDGDKNVITTSKVVFEGATVDAYETYIQVGAEPAVADTTLTLPTTSGTIALTTDIPSLAGYAQLSGATFTGAVTGTDLTLSGNLTVNGTTTTIDTQNLLVEDKNITIGAVTSPTDTTADGGGITLKGTSDKTFNWVDATDSWTSSEHINLSSGKSLKINGTDVLTSSQVLGKSLPSGDVVGTSDSQTLTNKTLNSPTINNATFTGQASGLEIAFGQTIVFEGTTADDYELTLSAGEPTADRTISFPDVSGTVVTTGDTGTVTSTMIANGTIVNADINASAAIDKTKISGTAITAADTGTITSTMIADGTIVNADINASAAIAVSKLAASTISGVTLGNNLNALTIGTGLSGTSYNGSTSVTIAINSTVATTSGSQTLTNKTIALGSNTVSGTLAQFNSALTDADFVSLAGAETLTNKTLGSTTTLGANLNANSNKITSLGTPTASTDAATKQYVDDIAQGLHIHESVVAATTANLNATYDNGSSGVGATLTNAGTLAAFSVDGVSPALNSRILVKNQSTTLQNGIYTLTTVGTASVAWVLTRATDFDTPTEIDGGDFVFVTGGTAGDNTGWVQTETVSTVGTSAILFTQFSGAGTYLAGNGLTLTGNTFTINTSITADLSTAQTLTNKTLSLGSNTVSGTIAQFNTALTDADFATLAGSETFTNKTLTSPVITGLTLNDSSIVFEGSVADAFETTLTVTNPTADRTITLPDATGTIALQGFIPASLTWGDLKNGKSA